MPGFNLQRFLAETGLSIARLASYLQVARTYLEAAARGQTPLTRRDQEACRALWRRLVRVEQIELPFAEPAETFTREHALRLARARAAASAAPAVGRSAPDGGTPRRSRAGPRKPTPGRKAPPKARRGGGVAARPAKRKRRSS